MNESSERVLNVSISDYFDLYYKHHQRKKLVLFITKKQMAYMVGNQIDHWGKTAILSQQLFPERNYDYDRYYEGAISIYSVGNDIEINLPDAIDKTQYECLVELINEIEKYEKENNIKIEYFGDKEELLNEARSKIKPTIEDDEEIISEQIMWGEDIIDSKPHNIKKIGLDESSLEDDGRSMI